jgi:predicted aldo/keto reductase-like oxidoreductase
MAEKNTKRPWNPNDRRLLVKLKLLYPAESWAKIHELFVIEAIDKSKTEYAIRAMWQSLKDKPLVQEVQNEIVSTHYYYCSYQLSYASNKEFIAEYCCS